MLKPHIANLRFRAKAFNMCIARTTMPEDARMFGEHRYILYPEGQDWQNMNDTSLYSIRAQIEILEKEEERAQS